MDYRLTQNFGKEWRGYVIINQTTYNAILGWGNGIHIKLSFGYPNKVSYLNRGMPIDIKYDLEDYGKIVKKYTYYL